MLTVLKISSKQPLLPAYEGACVIYTPFSGVEIIVLRLKKNWWSQAESALVFFSYSVGSGVIYLFRHLGLLISHSPGSFFRTGLRGLWKKQGSSINCIVISVIHRNQMYKIENTNGTQAEGASPAPFGCSNVLISWRRYQKRKASLNAVLMCLYKDAYILTKLGCFLGSPHHVLSQHLHLRGLLSANMALLKRPAC